MIKRKEVASCSLEETAEVLAAAGRPREDAVVAGQRRGHDVALGLLADVSFAIMDHSKTENNKAVRTNTDKLFQCDIYCMMMSQSIGNTYLCPDSWAMVKARPSPVSSLMVQLRYRLHIPLIGAKPAITLNLELHLNHTP